MGARGDIAEVRCAGLPDAAHTGLRLLDREVCARSCSRWRSETKYRVLMSILAGPADSQDESLDHMNRKLSALRRLVHACRVSTSSLREATTLANETSPRTSPKRHVDGSTKPNETISTLAGESPDRRHYWPGGDLDAVGRGNANPVHNLTGNLAKQQRHLNLANGRSIMIYFAALCPANASQTVLRLSA